jgi:hypothetical protein
LRSIRKKNVKPYSKIMKAKSAGGMTQVEHLLAKDKALSSNPVP